jgi:hypothetical protein
MAEADPIRRIKAAAQRAAGETSVDTQQRWYRETLEQDLAPSADALDRRRKSARRGRRLGLLGWTVILLFIASVTVAGLFVHQMWQNGALLHLMDSPFKHKADDSGWMAGKERAWPQAGETSPDAASVTEPPLSLVEPISTPAPQSAPSASDDATPAENADPSDK